MSMIYVKIYTFFKIINVGIQFNGKTIKLKYPYLTDFSKKYTCF